MSLVQMVGHAIKLATKIDLAEMPGVKVVHKGWMDQDGSITWKNDNGSYRMIYVVDYEVDVKKLESMK